PTTYGRIPYRTAVRIAAAHAREAIRLARTPADGYAALGLAPADDQASIAALKRAIALDPSRADVRIWIAISLDNLGRYDEALQMMRQAAAIEPLWPLPLEGVVQGLTMNGQAAEARHAVEQFRARGGNQAQYYRLLFLIDLHGPNLSSAVAEGERAHSI